MTRNDFYAEWLNHFACGISQTKIQKYVVSTGNYLWHIFSWGLLNGESFLVGDAAKRAYNEQRHNDARYIKWFEDDIVKPLPPTMYTANALDNLTEVYIVASDFSWTYIKTHESMCGPYFMKR